ncbi:MAG: NAD(P) transhydrogenase subunit alpha [Haloarculaceae archaeon]
MNVGVPGETAPGESRVALVPPVAGKLVDRGIDVRVAAGAGADATWTDAQYREAGCEVLDDRSEVFGRSDVVLQVRGLGANPDAPDDPYREGQVVVGLLGPYGLDAGDRSTLVDRGLTAFALELIPRTGRAQSMDVLTSMASVAGYKAAVLAADTLPKLFPMQMTAAGTVRPAEVFVVGAGVAGLQAIATARRLGASVRAYDIRPAVREEVQSLGAEFVDLELETEAAADESGYARELEEAFYRRQRETMTRVVAEADVLITSAAVPGRPSPELVSGAMIEGMDDGSVVVDLGAEGGGNCEPTRPDETVEYAGVTVLGPTNLPGRVSHTASRLFSNNATDFLLYLLEDGELVIDTGDEIVDATLLAHEGTVRHPRTDDEGDDAEDSDGTNGASGPGDRNPGVGSG